MDILIAGGGISGCYTGQLLKKKGFDPLIIEEHSGIGTPVQCAGLVGRETVETSRIPFPHQTIVRRIDGARFFLGNDSFEIERTKAAYVIDREQLDKYFAKGLTIHTGEKVVTIKGENPLRIDTTKDTYMCDVLLGCDGPFSITRTQKDFNLNPIFYPGAQYILNLTPEDDFVEVHVNPPFFFWVVPETEETTRIGFIGPRPVYQLKRFIERKELHAKIVTMQAGIISIGYGDIVRKKVALLGDAACQVKPLTGGGIFYSMKAAEILATHIKNLPTYEKKWNSKFGREIKVGLRIRNIYENMSRKNLKRIFNVFKENTDTIETVADFERHSSIVKEFAKNPVMWKLVGSAVKEFLK